MIQMLESIDRSSEETKRVLQEKRKTLSTERLVLNRLIRLYRPFKHIIAVDYDEIEVLSQLIVICVLTLRQTFSSYKKKHSVGRLGEKQTLKPI
jgi:hypothetical protein